MSASEVAALVAMLRALPGAGVLLSGTGMVLAANGPAREALGLDAEQPEGCRLVDRTAGPPDDMQAYVRACARCADPVPGAFSIQRPSSDPVPYLCSGGLILRRSPDSPSVIFLRFWPKAADGNPFVLLNQKLTELTDEVHRRREAEEALRVSEGTLRARALEAEGVNRAKDEFLATLSHELRTPLNAVLGWARMLREGALPEDRRQQALETIERNARAQAQLVEELLDISTIITGKLKLNVQRLELIHVAEAALENVRPAADAKGIRIEPVLDPNAGLIMGDAGRLQQVCWNLLSNAVKFTPAGGRVQVILERVGASIELTVADTGKGIAADFLPFVFDRFRQQDGSVTRRFGGLGLGLSIVKNLVELHGGTARVESAGEGKGAAFVVRLPRMLLSADGAERRPSSAASLPDRDDLDCPPEIDGLSILVVDDEPDALDMVVLMLEQCGGKVRGARSAAEGFEALQSLRPDVLISDVGMPGEDGYSLIERVRALSPSAGGRTPAIALTAFARTEDRTRALKAGFQAHVAKPVESTELLAVMASLVARFSSA